MQPEHDIIQAMIDSRNSQHITHKELALPTPEKSIQQIEKEQIARLREKAKKGKIMLDE